jgi:hypothetical protein
MLVLGVKPTVRRALTVATTDFRRDKNACPTSWA